MNLFCGEMLQRRSFFCLKMQRRDGAGDILNQKLVDGTFTQNQFCSQHDHIRETVGGVETVDQKVNGSSAHFV